MQLRKLKEKDIPLMLEWMQDPQVNQFFRFDTAGATPESAAQFVAAAQHTGENLHLACVDENDTYLGTISLKHIDKTKKEAEYATSFRRAAQGTGAAAFATREVLDMAFGPMGLCRVYLNVLADNGRALRFYEKMGFVPAPPFEEMVTVRGVLKKLLWLSITSQGGD